MAETLHQLWLRLGFGGTLLILALLYFFVRACIVAWRDKNGNGVIDGDE